MCPLSFDSLTRWPTSRRLFHHTDFFWRAWAFCVAVSFTDIVEQFWGHIQNPFFYVVLLVLMLALYDYPKLRNHCWKVQKTIWKVSAGFRRRKAPSESFPLLKMLIAQLKIGLESKKLVSIVLPCYEDSEYVLNISLWCLWTKRHCKTSGDTIYCHLRGRGSAVGQIGPQSSGNSNTFGIWWKL